MVVAGHLTDSVLQRCLGSLRVSHGFCQEFCLSLRFVDAIERNAADKGIGCRSADHLQDPLHLVIRSFGSEPQSSALADAVDRKVYSEVKSI